MMLTSGRQATSLSARFLDRFSSFYTADMSAELGGAGPWPVGEPPPDRVPRLGMSYATGRLELLPLWPFPGGGDEALFYI